MCTSNNFPGALIPYGLKIPNPIPGGGMAHYPMPTAGLPPAVMELQRAQAQLYDYNARLRFGLHYAAAAGLASGSHGFNPYHPGSPHDHLALLYGKHDPRTRFLHEEPKPSHSYIGLIAMGILSNKDKKMVLSDIYQHILDNYAYFRTRGPGWRNSIRHNLSLNDCFIKSGRSANGKGHYWAVHPANVDDFSKGDFRRRRAQRKVRKAMGLAVPDDEDSPSPPPRSGDTHMEWTNRVMGANTSAVEGDSFNMSDTETDRLRDESKTVDILSPGSNPSDEEVDVNGPVSPAGPSADRISDNRSTSEQARLPLGLVPTSTTSKKRLFDVESLLAPDNATKRVHHDLFRFPQVVAGACFHPYAIRGGFGSSPVNFLPPNLMPRDFSVPKCNIGSIDSDPDRGLLKIDTLRDTSLNSSLVQKPRTSSESSSNGDHSGASTPSPCKEVKSNTDTVSPSGRSELHIVVPKVHVNVAHHHEDDSPHSKTVSSSPNASPERYPQITKPNAPGLPGVWQDRPSAFRSTSLQAGCFPGTHRQVPPRPLLQISGAPMAAPQATNIGGIMADSHRLQEMFSRAMASQIAHAEIQAKQSS